MLCIPLRWPAVLSRFRTFCLVLIFVGAADSPNLVAASELLRIATFQVDATPPLGSPLCDAAVPPAKEIVDPLSVRGIVLVGSGQPIVLCAVDWVGIANGGQDAWREALAAAAGTSADRVAVHTLHQHDAPGCDFDAEEILAAHGLSGRMFPVDFARATIARAASACRKALERPAAVTHIGLGRARVEKVASSRRPLGPDGKVKFVRWSGNNDAKVRAEPEGTIDPDVRLISFWNGERPVAVLSYYATHPMSAYGHGGVSADFVGLARSLREEALPGVALIHFDGAGGDVTAGKYNGGTPADRRALGERLAAGMKRAWDSTHKVPIGPHDVDWRTTSVSLPLGTNLKNESALLHDIDSQRLNMVYRVRSAIDLAWINRVRSGRKIVISRLTLGPAKVLHMPGELSVEYQLAAQKLHPQSFVAMAAYGDYGPGYVCMSAHYSQGGYEPTASRVGPGVESVLMEAIDDLLK
jgi:hypothetical protein